MRELGLDLMPKTDYPTVTVSVSLQGASAEEVYRRLSTAELRGFRLGLVHGQLDSAAKMAAFAKEKGWKKGDYKKLNLPFENILLGQAREVRERMAQAVELPPCNAYAQQIRKQRNGFTLDVLRRFKKIFEGILGWLECAARANMTADPLEIASLARRARANTVQILALSLGLTAILLGGAILSLACRHRLPRGWAWVAFVFFVSAAAWFLVWAIAAVELRRWR